MRRIHTITKFRTLQILCSLVLAVFLVSHVVAQEQGPQDSAYPTVRIVDPAKVRREPTPLVRIGLAPFSLAGSGMERGLYLVEEHKLQDRLQIILGNRNIHPLFGSLGDDSGFGGGFAFSTVGVTAPHFGFIGDFHVTAKKYMEANGGVRFRQNERIGEVVLDLTAGYRLRPEEDFWGIGAEPGSPRSNFNLQERSVRGAMEVRHSNQLRSGWEVKYSATSIFAGEDALYPSTGAVFTGAALPGLEGGGELFETSLFAEYDTRSGSTSLVRGFYLRGSISSVDGVNGSDFSYWRYAVDQRFYVPLGNERRVFAVRTLLAFTDTRDDSQIPFFRLARLGDTQTLRGYDANRFYGRNAAAWNAEYRTDLTGGLGAFAFTDFGQVFDRASEFNTANFRVTYGGGVQLKTKKSIVLRTYVARSQERTRLMISFGPTF